MMSTNYNRGDVGIVPFTSATSDGALQKALPALVTPDPLVEGRFDDLITVGITPRIVETPKETEHRIVRWAEDFKHSGLIKTSVIWCEHIMTVPRGLVTRLFGHVPDETIKKIDKKLNWGVFK